MKTTTTSTLIKELQKLSTQAEDMESRWMSVLRDLGTASPFAAMTGGAKEASAPAPSVPTTTTTTRVPPQEQTKNGGGGYGGAVRHSILAYMRTRQGQKVPLEDILKNVVGAKDRKHVLTTLTNLKGAKHLRGVGRGFYRLPTPGK